MSYTLEVDDVGNFVINATGMTFSFDPLPPSRQYTYVIAEGLGEDEVRVFECYLRPEGWGIEPYDEWSNFFYSRISDSISAKIESDYIAGLIASTLSSAMVYLQGTPDWNIRKAAVISEKDRTLFIERFMEKLTSSGI